MLARAHAGVKFQNMEHFSGSFGVGDLRGDHKEGGDARERARGSVAALTRVEPDCWVPEGGWEDSRT